MACCTLPDHRRYCRQCGMPVLVETDLAVMVFSDHNGARIDCCPGCDHWLDEETTSREPVAETNAE